jgi:cytokinesis protein
MLSYPAAKKWTLIQSDAQQEYESERKRATIGEGDRSTPEWYVRKIVDGTIAIKELGSLSVSLRTEPITWVRKFLGLQGMIALTKVLSALGVKGIKSDQDVTREYEIVKCLKTLLNNKVPLIQKINISLEPMPPWIILLLFSHYVRPL